MGSDDAQSVCDSTLDSNGTPCVWCDVANSGYGVCLSHDAASAAGQYFTCDAKEEDSNEDVPDDLVKCFMHKEQDECDAESCIWCNTLAGVGVCFSEEACEVAKMYEPFFNCDDDTPTTSVEESDVWDPTCLMVGFQGGDEDTCENAQDQNGNPCVWCDNGEDTSTGVCMTYDQSSVMSQWLTCHNTDIDIFFYAVESPMDPTCLAAGYQGDDAEETCHSTNDEDGNACVWCAGPSPNMGVCLSPDQAAIAGQWLTCEDPSVVEEEEEIIQSPMDPTCIVVGFQGGDKDTCENTEDQDGNPCVWCDGGDASTGICLTSDQASIASQWLTCDDSTDAFVGDEIESPMDQMCLGAGFEGDDGEATCHATNDDDGKPCVWCEGPTPSMGVCLSSDQAAFAEKWLSCEEKAAVDIESS